MYLKSLFLHGFKSFPSSVTLEFNKGITSVVGPNGSGKSNVSDAIRWVLGEQSAKNLRGAKMEDVIFFGTANRKSVGYCEVSMVLDNSDRLISLDFDEIKITRRQTRSGESTYQINGINSRLKDVLELFMDTGIGKEGYSIIGQGRIEEILKAKSDERRLLFEEATGIVKYKKRKFEASQKLAKQKDNLIRINDILKELEVQVGPLKSQSEKAKKYLSLYENKKKFQIALFLNDVNEKERIEKEYIKDIDENKRNIEEQKKEYSTKEETIKILKTEQDDISNTLKGLNEELTKTKENFVNLSHSININEEKISSINLNLSRLENEIETSNVSIKNYQEQIELENLNIKTSEQKLLELSDALIKNEEELKTIQEGAGLNDQTIKELNSKILENAEEIATINNKINHEEEIYENLNNETEDVVELINSLNKEIIELNLVYSTSEKLVTELEKELETLKSDIKIFEENVKVLKEELFKLRNEQNVSQKKYHEKNARFKALNDARNSHLGYFDSVKYVLNQNYKGVLGAVGDIFSTKFEYEQALEIALAGQVQNIVTDNEETAKNLINNLRENNKGRCTFLPLNKVRLTTDVNKNFLSEKGVIGFFSDLVTYDEIFEPIANSLLQKTLVIDTLENAVIFNNKHKNKIRIVTLTGDVLSTTGSMTGGSNKKSGSSIFSNKRLLSEAEIEVSELKEKLANIEENLSIADEKSKNYKEELSYARTLFTEKQQNLLNNKNNYDTSKLKLQYKQDELNKTKEKDNSLLSQIEEKNIEIKKLYELLKELQKTKDSLNQELSDFSKNIDSHNDEKDKQQNALMELNVLITKENVNISNYNENRNRIYENIKTCEKIIISLKEKIIEENKSKSSFEEAIEQNNLSKNELAIKNEKLTKEISSKENLLNEKQNTQTFLTDSNKDLFMQISEIEKKLTKDELMLQNITEQISKLYDDMWNEYELTYQKCLEYPKVEIEINELKKLHRNISTDIKQLGNVNILAIDQYKEVSERFEFLLEQKQDIVEGEKKLDIIIKDLTNLMEQQFTEQFITIRKNFKDVFISMFGGGNADLVLSEPDDPLNSPIEILAEPPGKKLKNLMLMSGGEKSLTAICLLFGILKMKPSPFCILDEIEAALDDANVDRYAQFLAEFKNETQFILITHRKGTMVIADTLYGVTMEEMGISKLVSVKLEDYE